MPVLTLLESPPEFCSAYKPLSIGVTSSKHPNNTTPGESGISITTIKLADAADVLTYGAPLAVGDLFINHSTTPLGVLPAGQTLKITGCSITSYNGVWRVLKEVTDKVKVIACDNFGTATVGTLEKYYNNYTLVATLTNQSSVGYTTYDISPDQSGVFYMDPSDHLRATFKDIFLLAESGVPFSAIDAERYITQTYGVLFSEAYDIPDANGVSAYTKLEKLGATLLVRDLIAVNNVQPYHHLDEPDGAPDLLWEDDLDDYTVTSSGTYRWLTYRETGVDYNERTAHRCSYSDAVWLAILYAGDTSVEGNTGYRIRHSYVLSSGASATTFTNMVLEKDSYLFNVGAEALALPSDIVRYSIALYLGNTEVIPPTWYTIDEPCFPATRFHVFNRFGALDNYTVDGSRIGRSVDVRRKVVSKSSMSRTITTAGDHQRRTYASDPLAIYSQTTRKEGQDTARWILDELLSSPDVRVQIYDGANPAYTRIIFDTNKADAGIRASKFDLSWTMGTDNQRQRR